MKLQTQSLSATSHISSVSSHMGLMVTELGREHFHCHRKFQNVCSLGTELCAVPLCLQHQMQCPPHSRSWGCAGVLSEWVVESIRPVC